MTKQQKKLFEKKYKREIWFRNSDKIWGIGWKNQGHKEVFEVCLREEIGEETKKTLMLKCSCGKNSYCKQVSYEFIVKKRPKIKISKIKTQKA